MYVHVLQESVVCIGLASTFVLIEKLANHSNSKLLALYKVHLI